jgi:hypothetical protein
MARQRLSPPRNKSKKSARRRLPKAFIDAEQRKAQKKSVATTGKCERRLFDQCD